jgi:hypothetical protein
MPRTPAHVWRNKISVVEMALVVNRGQTTRLKTLNSIYVGFLGYSHGPFWGSSVSLTGHDPTADEQTGLGRNLLALGPRFQPKIRVSLTTFQVLSQPPETC